MSVAPAATSVGTARTVGAIAGLLPPAFIVAWYFGTGGPAHGAPALLRLIFVGVVAGWFVGPRAKGSISRRLTTLISYFLVAYALLASVDFVFLVAEDIQAGRGHVLQRAWEIAFVRLLYLPVWAVLLSPATAAWLLAVQLLRLLFQIRAPAQ